MQMREVARGVQYINRERSLSRYLALPSASLLSRLYPPNQPPKWPSLEDGKPRPRRDTISSASCSVSNPTLFSATTTHAFYLSVLSKFSGPFFFLGIPDDIIEKGRDYKLITEVTQDGDTYSWTQIYPTNAKVTNTFIIGKECDMETIGGKKFKVDSKESRAYIRSGAGPKYKSMRGIINSAEREGRRNVLWLIPICVFSGNCAHRGRQAECDLPQLPPYL